MNVRFWVPFDGWCLCDCNVASTEDLDFKIGHDREQNRRAKACVTEFQCWVTGAEGRIVAAHDGRRSAIGRTLLMAIKRAYSPRIERKYLAIYS